MSGLMPDNAQAVDHLNRSFFSNFIGLVGKLERRRAWQLAGLVLLAIASSFIEVMSIAALFPFLGLLGGGQVGANSGLFEVLYEWVPALRGQQTIFIATALLVAVLTVAAVSRIMANWVNARMTEAIGTEIATLIFRRMMYQAYLRHVSRNSSEIIAALTGKVGTVVSNIIAPTLLLVQSAIIAVGIVTTLIVVNWLVACLMMVLFGVLYAGIIFTTRERLAVYSVSLSALSNEIIKLLQESLGGIRDVLIDGSQEVYCTRFHKLSADLRRVQANVMIVSTSPAYIIVTLGMIILSVMGAYFVGRDGAASNALPLLGAFALGAQRLLPMLQQIYSCWSIIRSSNQAFVDVLNLLDEPMENPEVVATEPLPLARSIELSNVAFCYPGRDVPVLKNFNMQIAFGQRVGICGVTGGGKSTLLDILMGLLPPTEGALVIDGVPVKSATQPAWRRNIAHVPQVIHLVDGSLLENIALGVARSEVVMERVLQAARGAQIADTIATWPKGFETEVGERGVRLSGGQRQRIGIARALYKNASVVVFDEATSALDTETESGVIDALNAFGRDITVIMVAHRLTTLMQCDVIYELAHGTIVRSGSYAELFGAAAVLEDDQ
ncbi:ATP-binding cassette domain-containing protein (plasmid) [Agrobacterium sp. MA01]|uniref:ABC transporter ATP-binding protein n=1 Tax=Agrobacterium sp. MA01 TaxID=2664893 RepID=UPI00129B0321|nr:ABC transporter ATP-binding protein [Agrobacterium sp. MA01]QGG93503.1 ATP-binding cassette domain-containing protein [Agrobacterium sp. MA01]